MEQASREQIDATLKQGHATIPAATLEHVFGYVERFAAAGYTGSFALCQGEDINHYAELFDLGSLEGKTILRRYQHNAVAGEADCIDTPVVPAIEGLTVEDLLQHLGNLHTSDDFANDFQAGIVVQLDAETAIAFGMKHEEFPGICADCAETGYDDAYFGCEHDEPETYEANYWFMLCQPNQIDQIIWDRAEVTQFSLPNDVENPELLE